MASLQSWLVASPADQTCSIFQTKRFKTKKSDKTDFYFHNAFLVSFVSLVVKDCASVTVA